MSDPVDAFLESDPVFEVLRLMNFQTCPLAHLFRDDGAAIPRKVEDEQAYVLRWLLQLAHRHGDGWPKVADEYVQQVKERVRAKGGAT